MPLLTEPHNVKPDTRNPHVPHEPDAGKDVPERKASAEHGSDSEVFSADAQVLPSTANAKDGTIDVVWYSGAFVPRIDRSTGESYMLKLDMQGCRFDRLNNGAPIFDTHFTGDDFKSLIAGKVGTRAQVGVVRRAWPNGDKGMATLQFDLGDPDGTEMFRKASTGNLQVPGLMVA
jgi:hypothetical protein